jgi:hypothetical protein
MSQPAYDTHRVGGRSARLRAAGVCTVLVPLTDLRAESSPTGI